MNFNLSETYLYKLYNIAKYLITDCVWNDREPTRWQHNRIYPHPINPCVYTYDSIVAATNESQKTLNKCETRNKTVFHTRLRHPETINSVLLNSVLRIKQIGV